MDDVATYGRVAIAGDTNMWAHYKNVRGPKQHPKYIGARFGVPA